MQSIPTNNSLLIEFLSEELPPINLVGNIGNAFSAALGEQLLGFTNSNTKITSFIAPRRFGCVIEGIKFAEGNQRQVRKGPAITTGFKDGKPTPALLGFAKSCSTQWEQLEQRADGYFYAEVIQRGQDLAAVLGASINQALKRLQIAKAMRWGDSEYQFVRPVHNLVVMFNEQVIPCEALGLTANNTTWGHRFMSHGKIVINHAADYLQQINTQGNVIADFAVRRTCIAEKLNAAAAALGLQINPMEGLLDEVTALVEWPEVLLGSFAAKFLAVPQECLILSMAKNQKYFALLDQRGKLSHKFLFVANLISQDPQVIIDGNQKVLSARLADAEFFYEFDKRTPLAQFVNKMATVVYHNKLGSQLERIQRIQQISAEIAQLLGVNTELAQHAALLLKADLVTEMVGEFPELQGVMGKYYALASGEKPEVASAIEQHYYPRFSGDVLPQGALAITAALADKLESLVGIWGIGLIPSGDKDPFALRRAALGIIRMCLNLDIDLKHLLQIAFSSFAGKNLAATSVEDVYQFILGRVANYFSVGVGYATKVVHAVIAARDLQFSVAGAKKLNYLPSLLASLSEFAANSDNQSLFQANKRIENILRKNETELSAACELKSELFQEPAERALYHLFKDDFDLGQVIVKHTQQQAWLEYFQDLAKFKQPLDQFFAEVMVMAEEPATRHNRLSLLRELHKHFNLVCILSELA